MYRTKSCCTSDVLLLKLCDVVDAFWQNHSSEFPPASLLQSRGLGRRLTLHGSVNVDGTSAAGEQRDNSSADSSDVNWMVTNSKICIVTVHDNFAVQCWAYTTCNEIFVYVLEFSSCRFRGMFRRLFHFRMFEWSAITCHKLFLFCFSSFWYD